jgi:adenosylhomocysteine nucleosidase
MTRGPRRRKQLGSRQQAPILVITGLTREADCLRGEGVTFLCSGADANALRRALAEKESGHYSAVVSFGLAGGLDPMLRPGDAVVATYAVSDTETDERLHPVLGQVLMEGFSGAGVAARHGAVFGVDAPVMTVAEKSLLRQRSGAAAVDMESHLADAFARRNDLPFAIVRVIGDPAGRALPPLAGKAIRPDGGVDVGFVMKELARQPAQLGDLVRAGFDARAAFSTLRRCGGLLGPLLGLALA